MDIANLQIKADSRQVQQAVEALKGLGIEAEVTERKNKKLKKSQFELNDVFGKSVFTIKNLIGTYLTFNSLKIADQFTLLKARVEQSTESTSEFEKVFAKLQTQAVETGSALESSVEIFQRLSFSRKEINATAEDMLAFTKAVQQLGTISGAQTANLNAGLRQLGQALGSPIVRAEEFNSVLENIPAVANKISEGLGLTVAQMRNLVIEGNLASKDVFEVIRALQEQINFEFNQFKENNPLSFALSQLRQSFQNYIGNLNESIGVTGFLADIAKFLAANLESVGKAATIAAGAMAGFVIASNAAAISAFATSIIGAGVAFIQLAASVRTAAGAVALFNLVFAFGPGALLVGLGAVGAAAYVFRDDIQKAFITTIARMIVLVDELAEKLQKLADFGATGLGALFFTIQARMQGIDQSIIDQTLAEEGRRQKKRNFTGITKLSAEELGQAAKEMINELNKVTPSGSNNFNEVFELSPEVLKKLEELRSKYKGLLGETGDLTGETKKLKDAKDASNATIEKSKSALQQYGEEARNVTDQLQDMGVRGIKSLEDNLVGLIRGTVSVADAFNSMADQIIDDLIRIQVRKSITEPLSGALESFLPSVGSALFGGGGGIGLSSGAIDLASGGNLFKFNTGGSFKVGGSGGPDSQFVPLQLTPGEVVNVRKGGQQEQRTPNIIINNNAPQAQVSAGVGANGFDINVVIDDAFANNASRRGTKTFAALNNLGTPLSRG